MPHAVLPLTAEAVFKTRSRAGFADTEVRRDALGVVLAVIVLCAWDASGLDIVLTRWYGTPTGFAWANHWVLSGVLHNAARYPAWLLFAVLVIGIFKPMGATRSLTRGERIWWVSTTAGCVALISFLKYRSATSCPFELAEFGGAVSHYVPHWRMLMSDGGPGRCFPSGHASTAFAFFAGWFALRRTAPRLARVWLGVVLLLGAVFAWVQLVRGAHYLSHSLWTAWICWAATTISYRVTRAFATRSDFR